MRRQIFSIKGLAFYDNSKEQPNTFRPRREGRAKNLANSEPFPKWVSEKITIEEGFTGPSAELLYVSANGKILGYCDFSYEDIDRVSKFDIWHLDDAVSYYYEEPEGSSHAAF